MERNHILVWIILFFFCEACAFKNPSVGKPGNDEPVNPRGESSPNTNPSDIPIGPDSMQMNLDWKESESNQQAHHLSRLVTQLPDQPKEYFLSTPLTLSAVVPDEVELLLKLPPFVEKTAGDLTISVRANSSDLSLVSSAIETLPNRLPYQVENGLAQVKLKLRGIRSLLSDTEQQKSYFSIEVRLALTGLKLGTLNFTLATPPKSVVLEQRTLTQYDRSIRILGPDLRQVESPTTTLELIQVIEVSNYGHDAISVEMPVMLTGSLGQKRTWTSPRFSELCEAAQDTQSLDVTFSKVFYLFPFQEGLQENWVKWMAESNIVFTLSANNSKLIGIYAQNDNSHAKLGQQIKEAQPAEYSMAHPVQTVSVPSSCDFGCMSPNTSRPFEDQCKNIPASESSHLGACQQRLAACLPCIHRWFNRPTHEVDIEWGNDCNQCHALELQEEYINIIEYDGRLACYHDWQKRINTSESMLKGYQVGNVILNLDIDKKNSLVRFAHSNKLDDPEGRSISFLKASTIQD
jgi:hypothetical protein